MSSNDGEAVRAWTLEGLGIMVRSEWDVADDLRSGRLRRVLTHYRLQPIPWRPANSRSLS